MKTLIEQMMQNYYAPETGGGGGESSTNSEESTETTEEEQEPEFTDAQKAWMQKEIDKVKTQQNETAEQLAARLKAELQAEQDKTNKANARKAAADKAKADGNVAEQIRLANEERDALKLERDQAREAEQKTRETNAKLALVTKYKLPSGYENRILGADAAAWEVDAQELAKNMPTTAIRPNMEGGNKQVTTKEAQSTSAKKVATNFVSGF